MNKLTPPLILLILAALISAATGQGTLVPPGAPAPTMKSLDQVEPRTPISASTTLVTIATPGTYYLTGNITVSSGNGINITANNVSLDLNGFTISSTVGSPQGFGISVFLGTSGHIIKNGFITGTTTYSNPTYSGGTFTIGISSGSNAISISQMVITGMLVTGISDPNYWANVDHCVVRTAANNGIDGFNISNCIVYDAGSSGITGRNVSSCAVTGGGRGHRDQCHYHQW